MTDTSYMVHDYPDPPRERPNISCKKCFSDMSEEAYNLFGNWVCEECFMDYTKDLMPFELANLLDVEHVHTSQLEEEPCRI